MGADQLRDDPAALYVAGQDHRQIGGLGEAHIGDVSGAQIDLGGAACAFDDHQIAVLADDGEALQHSGHQGGLEALILGGVAAGQHAPLDDNLRAAIRLRFQQHRIHVAAERQPRRTGLQRLGATDLAAVGGDGGIVGHVLRLEGGHRQAAFDEGPAEAGDEKRFADVRARALDHERSGHVNPSRRRGRAISLDISGPMSPIGRFSTQMNTDAASPYTDGHR